MWKKIENSLRKRWEKTSSKQLLRIAITGFVLSIFVILIIILLGHSIPELLRIILFILWGTIYEFSAFAIISFPIKRLEEKK